MQKNKNKLIKKNWFFFFFFQNFINENMRGKKNQIIVWCGELTQKRFKSLCLLFGLIGYNNQKLSSSKEKSSKPKRRFSAYIIKSCVSHIIFIRWASPVIQIKEKSNYDSSLFSIIIIRHTNHHHHLSNFMTTAKCFLQSKTHTHRCHTSLFLSHSLLVPPLCSALLNLHSNIYHLTLHKICWETL